MRRQSVRFTPSKMSREFANQRADSCCGVNKKCGFGPDYCGQGNCTSNCDATAMCGRYSEGGNIKCGMNLCCSYYGWCGVCARRSPLMRMALLMQSLDQ